MKKLTLFLSLTSALLALCLIALPAYAQATRTWVSGVGDDANPCSRTAPCKTFAGAISKTAVKGEINCLDPGGFGAVTITKSITISCEIGTAGVLVSGTNEIVVSVLASDIVYLRGLDIQGHHDRSGGHYLHPGRRPACRALPHSRLQCRNRGRHQLRADGCQRALCVGVLHHRQWHRGQRRRHHSSGRPARAAPMSVLSQIHVENNVSRASRSTAPAAPVPSTSTVSRQRIGREHQFATS